MLTTVSRLDHKFTISRKQLKMLFSNNRYYY